MPEKIKTSYKILPYQKLTSIFENVISVKSINIIISAWSGTMLGYVSHPYSKNIFFSLKKFGWTYQNSRSGYGACKINNYFRIQHLKHFKFYVSLRIFSGDKSNQHDSGRLIPIKPGAVK